VKEKCSIALEHFFLAKAHFGWITKILSNESSKHALSIYIEKLIKYMLLNNHSPILVKSLLGQYRGERIRILPIFY